jgi:hypothetical protein
MKVARAGGEREQRAFFAECQLFQDGTDRGVLIVTPRGFATGVTREQRTGSGRVEADALCLLVTGAQIGGLWKLGERLGRGSFAGERIKFDKEMPIA